MGISKNSKNSFAKDNCKIQRSLTLKHTSITYATFVFGNIAWLLGTRFFGCSAYICNENNQR